MKWLKRRLPYTKRNDGKKWTKNAIIRQIIGELNALSPTLQGNSLIFTKDGITIKLAFIASSYDDKRVLELNATIFFITNNEELMWFDIFHLAKVYYGEEYRALKIMRDEVWSLSNLKKECQEFLLPLLRTLLDKQAAVTLLEKGESDQPDFRFKVPQNEMYTMLFDNGMAILAALRQHGKL